MLDLSFFSVLLNCGWCVFIYLFALACLLLPRWTLIRWIHSKYSIMCGASSEINHSIRKLSKIKKMMLPEKIWNDDGDFVYMCLLIANDWSANFSKLHSRSLSTTRHSELSKPKYTKQTKTDFWSWTWKFCVRNFLIREKCCFVYAWISVNPETTENCNFHSSRIPFNSLRRGICFVIG